jgi:hypothetical protein
MIKQKSPHAGPQYPAVEIDQQPDTQASATKVGQHLGLEHRVETINTLQLHNNCVCHNQVNTVLADRDALVFDWKHRLSLECNAALAQFYAHGCLVRLLQQTRPQPSMDLDSCD